MQVLPAFIMYSDVIVANVAFVGCHAAIYIYILLLNFKKRFVAISEWFSLLLSYINHYVSSF